MRQLFIANLLGMHHELTLDPALLNRLSAAEAEDLLTLARAANRRQHERLDEAITETLEHLPRLVRIPARKILFK